MLSSTSSCSSLTTSSLASFNLFCRFSWCVRLACITSASTDCHHYRISVCVDHIPSAFTFALDTFDVANTSTIASYFPPTMNATSSENLSQRTSVLPKPFVSKTDKALHFGHSIVISMFPSATNFCASRCWREALPLFCCSLMCSMIVESVDALVIYAQEVCLDFLSYSDLKSFERLPSICRCPSEHSSNHINNRHFLSCCVDAQLHALEGRKRIHEGF